MLFRILCVASTVALSFNVGSTAHAEDTKQQLALASTDWAWWRGPTRDGVADASQKAPLHWDGEKGVVWKIAVPGRGHGSPTVVGDRVFLATADEAAETQSVLCFDRKTGETLWETVVHRGGFETEGRTGHVRSSMASSTVACDGERVFINFLNDNAVHLTALDLSGKQLWQQKVSDFKIHQGFAASPALYGPLVIVSADHKGGGVISAFDRVTGDPAWSQKRPELPNYTSPIILNVAGSDQVILMGCDQVASYEPLTGKVNWQMEGATTECVTSVVSDGQHVVTSGGYPSKHIAVIKGDGSGETLWRNETMVYVPSMLVHDGYLYAVTDTGDAICYDLKTGEVKWEERLRAKFASSPLLVGDLVYATSDEGTTHIFKATPTGFAAVAENVIPADEVQATPAICGGQIFIRLAEGRAEDRQEMLYCLGL